MQLTAAVDGRSQEPRLQMLAILKLYRAREQSQEHVLRDVLGILVRACLRKRHAIYDVSLAVHGRLHELP